MPSEIQMIKPTAILGLDIGGANIKGARFDHLSGNQQIAEAGSIPFEVWRSPATLVDALSRLGQDLDAESCSHLALTMTAELCDSFATKREGVTFICQAVANAFPALASFVLDIQTGNWAQLEAASKTPLRFAANNWMASAMYVAKSHPNILLIDIGSTTCDIIPIIDGAVSAQGKTDTERLTHGELVYTGVLRSNPNTLVTAVPVRGVMCRLADERFSQMGDVHRILGNIKEGDYTSPTADGRGVTQRESEMRLARLVCSDSEALGARDLACMARYIYEAQVNIVTQATMQVLSGLDEGCWPNNVFPAGSGAFIAREVAGRLGLEAFSPKDAIEKGQEAVLPALAAAVLLSDTLHTS